ncbi:MAG: acyltransferase, partial [Deltaproteobacteria bacterium]|nr:acyltransferase [Deltaproteobacteria bacterium]
MARIADIERLRGAAVAMVLVHHAARFLPGETARALSAAGWSGVDLFFVISGFVVGASLLRSLPEGPSPAA